MSDQTVQVFVPSVDSVMREWLEPGQGLSRQELVAGAAIVGTPANEWAGLDDGSPADQVVDVAFEPDLPFAKRVAIAAGQHTGQIEATERDLLPRTDLVAVGTWDLVAGEFRADPEHAQALAAWLATEVPPAASSQPDPVEEAHAGLRPFTASFQGECASAVTVTAVRALDPVERPDDEAEWAADYGERQLVRVDTNYKPTRPGEHPVDLSRLSAARFAAAVLEAIEDTFHYARVGELRPDEATELLTELEGVDHALANLRSHALGDLCKRIDLVEDPLG